MEKPFSNNLDFIFIRVLIRIVALVLVLIVGFTILLILPIHMSNTSGHATASWKASDFNLVPKTKTGLLIRFGRELIINTGHYLGPRGNIRKMSNGINCQSCHLDAGTKPFGNNFGLVASTYPKYRPRYGSLESIEKRVNDCFQRSLNGLTLDSTSREMIAIVAYIRWVGKDVKKGETISGSGSNVLDFLDRPASPENGKEIYNQKCSICHGINGEGIIKSDSSWLNPPLWGDKSYNIGAGMYRLSRLAVFVKMNMPNGTSADAPQLTDEEAWDIAAYVNSMPRPEMNLEKDWPNILEKPPDYPFGPFIDTFNTEQHKYGPFKPILEYQQKLTTRAKK